MIKWHNRDSILYKNKVYYYASLYGCAILVYENISDKWQYKITRKDTGKTVTSCLEWDTSEEARKHANNDLREIADGRLLYAILKKGCRDERKSEDSRGT